jgi:cytochrome c-type biogenesis protein CcmE
MTRKQKRFAGIGVIGAVIGLAIFLVSVALRDEIVFFYDPTEVLSGTKVSPGQNFRIGGLVADGSVVTKDTSISFVVTDGESSVPVRFDGILPDLFREGQGVIAEGAMDTQGRFIAQNVLAKHDENYIPKELEDVMKKKEIWKGQQGENSS